jgi:hypothetical protein
MVADSIIVSDVLENMRVAVAIIFLAYMGGKTGGSTERSLGELRCAERLGHSMAKLEKLEHHFSYRLHFTIQI